MKGKKVFFFGIISLLCILWAFPAFAKEQYKLPISGKDYVLPEDSNFDYSEAPIVNSFFYGAGSMGTLYLYGAIEKGTVYNDSIAYGATGDLLFRYAYNGAFQTTEAESWHIEADGTRWIRDYDLGFLNNIASGCIMIEKSSDNRNWVKVIDPIKNYFNQAKSSDESLILTIPESDYKNGMYYRVVVAYKLARKTHSAFLADEYDRRKCVEVYEFYVASENNYITLQDIGNGSNLEDQASTFTGFIIHKNGSQDSVIVQGNDHECMDYDYFTDPGEYTVEITTKLGKKYIKTINVTNGINFSLLQSQTYESNKDNGFPLTKLVSYPVFGYHLTSLSLATPKGSEMKKSGDKYGITGKNVSLYLKLNHRSDDLGFGWFLTADAWGKNKNQQVNGIETGEVGRGALIIQTSNDGENWVNVDKDRYEKGLYTTDYAFHYGKAENVLIYTPSGQEVINGIYIRVLFAYQVQQATHKEYRDYVEAYQFYLCSNELGAVTFHNLSVAHRLDETFADADQNTVEVYKQAESLEDGAFTATGFQIDKKLNPTVKHDILLNGKRITNTQATYEKTGKYEINLTSAVGSTRKLMIYVDRLSPEEALKQYFGKGFISGKRIFSEGEYPVYEGGELNYYVAAVDSNILPLYGKITNLATGSVITIEQNHDEKTGSISEPGIYQAVFATSEKALTGELSGDARVFTFRFQVIQQGTAPGPVINQKLLYDYSHSTVTDCNPVYYGLTYSSAGKGNITLAFAAKAAAVEYAYNYEKGTVERQENGGYRYTGSFLVGQKIKFDSTWDLTDAVNYFAEAAAQKRFFDMADEFTYLSITPEVLKKYSNLRQLELGRSITIFADDQKEKLADIKALPLLNDKPYAFFDPETGEENRGFYSFEFVTDQYGGIDSKNVTIIDSEGGQHIIRYSDSVGQQLLADNCPSGIVTVREETMYGDLSEYPAVYIAPGDNTASLILTYKHGEESKTSIYRASEDGLEITADNFAITGLDDPLDPYALVIVKHKQYEEAYTAKDLPDIVWSDPGKYSITCVNRMGYSYSISLTVDRADGATIDNTMTFNAQDLDYTIAYQSRQSPSANTNDVRGTIQAKPEEQKTRNNTILIVVSILAGLGFIAGMIIFIYRRIKLFSRVSDNMKSEEEDKHE